MVAERLMFMIADVSIPLSNHPRPFSGLVLVYFRSSDVYFCFWHLSIFLKRYSILNLTFFTTCLHHPFYLPLPLNPLTHPLLPSRYDYFKAELLSHGLFDDNIYCHFSASFAAVRISQLFLTSRYYGMRGV